VNVQFLIVYYRKAAALVFKPTINSKEQANVKTRSKAVYWWVTGTWAVLQFIPGVMNFFVPMVAERFRTLGYPQHLRLTLGFAEVFGVLAVVVPQVPFRIKEAASAGFVYLYCAAFIAHVAVGDPLTLTVQPLLALALFATSYVLFHQRHVVFADKRAS
jgi:uncharacterized membrane protein YhaH (DUF805 family)